MKKTSGAQKNQSQSQSQNLSQKKSQLQKSQREKKKKNQREKRKKKKRNKEIFLKLNSQQELPNETTDQELAVHQRLFLLEEPLTTQPKPGVLLLLQQKKLQQPHPPLTH